MLKIFMAGALGQDAVVRILDNGNAAISFSIAHSEKWKNAAGQQQERTTWANCTLWRKSDQTRIAEYLKKGTKVLVEGTPSARGWSSPSGEAKCQLEINVKELEFMSSKPQTTAAGPSAPAPTSSSTNQTVSYVDDNDDLPF